MKKSNQKIICRSIMKTDIKGFSNKVGLLDDLELSKLLNEHKIFIKQKVTKYDGKVIKGEGDSFWIIFESATNAVQSAIDIQDELRTEGIGKKGDSRLSIRISISLGDIIEQGQDIFGEAVNLCARIENITPPDEIYLSNSTFLALRKQNINIVYIGEYNFKGFNNKEKIYKVLLKHNTQIMNDVYIWFSDIEKFAKVSNNIELVESIYDEYDRVVQDAIQKYDGRILNIIADTFLISFNNGDKMFKATQQLFIKWDKYLKKMKIDNFIRVGVHKGTVRMYRALISGNDFNEAAVLESNAKQFDIKRRNILALSREAYKGITSKKIKNMLQVIPNEKLSKDAKVRERMIERYKKIYIFYTN